MAPRPRPRSLARWLTANLSVLVAVSVAPAASAQGTGAQPFAGRTGSVAAPELVGLAPDNHGTSFWGLLTTPPFNEVLFAALGPAIADQRTDSELIWHLNEGGVTPGPSYAVIATDPDWIVTPWVSGFLPNTDPWRPSSPDVTNILLQVACPTNFAEHLSIPFNPAAIAQVLHALDPSYVVETPCTISLPVVGG